MQPKPKTFPLPKIKQVSKDDRLERDIQRACLDYLKSIPGIWVLRVEGGGKLAHNASGGVVIPSAMAGVPDIIFVLSGRFYACEVKRRTGRVAGAQLSHLYRIKCAGGNSALVTSVEGLAAFMRGEKALAELHEIGVY